GPSAVLDALVHRQDAHIARVRQAAMAVQGLHAAQHLRVPVALDEAPVHEVRAREVEAALVAGLALVLQEAGGVLALWFLGLAGFERWRESGVCGGRSGQGGGAGAARAPARGAGSARVLADRGPVPSAGFLPVP